MRYFAILLGALLGMVPAEAQSGISTLLVNGKVLTMDSRSSTSEALLVRDGRIAASGKSADLRKMAGPQARVIDLEGRTVIPGLIDSHMHAIRAALSFSTEVNWIGTRTLGEALDRIRAAAHTMAPGAWLIVAGGWNAQQFRENRRPTQAELMAAAPDNPVYVQLGYGWAMLTPKALEKLKIASDADLPAGGKLERDSDGKPTGGVSGGQNAIIALFDRLPTPTPDQEVAGTKKFFRELNRLGLTGVVDPGGNNMAADSYQAIFKVWRQGGLTVRVAYSLCGITPGKEFDELKDLTQLLPMGFGNRMLRFNGIGERITWAMNNNNNPSEAEREKYYEIVRWAAERGMAVTMHWPRNDSVGVLLDIFERVNKEVPITNLRWSIAHLNNGSAESFRRMKALGIGWTMQPAQRVPPVETAKEIGVAIGAGTDAHRVASYNPFTALQSMLGGNTANGVPLPGPAEERPSRAEALRLYTLGSAWFAHDDDERGSLEQGKLADLAVLSTDYMNAPVKQIGATESLMTMVGGKIVYAAGPFAHFEERH
ncbi:MAG TPA: amidohydrolase [Bryobacteraceae bacterium]|nr:amidohydrolase [Bryobacteraceae bacterium]